MSFLSISLLGSFQTTLDGQLIDDFEYNKVKGLLAYLAVESDRPHHRELLADTFWPDRPAQMARNSLRQALSILRNAIKDREAQVPFLLVSRDSVQFNRRSDYWLDIDVFMDSLTSCRDSLRKQSDPTGSACLHWFRQAARLYRGDFLDQFLINDSEQFTQWMTLKREEYRRLAAEVFWLIASYHEKNGEFEEVRKYAERQVELDPTNEEAHRRLMRVYYQQGERSNAMAQYELCRRSLSDYLGVLPEEETRHLYERIRNSSEEQGNQRGGNAVGLISRPHNLPGELSPLIGREKELQTLKDLLTQKEVRILTITGQGGVGKSRLSLRAATDLLEQYEDGVFFVSLASFNDVESIPLAIAEALGLSFFGEINRSKHLLGYLRERNMLLVFDNFEHIIEGKHLIAEILQYSSGVKVIVTCREPLLIPGEHILGLTGLSYPAGDNGEETESFSAVQLFVRNARRARADFTLNENNRGAVARICGLLEGLPLGIELAASWIRVLEPDEIVKEIETSSDFLESSSNAHPDRHRSLRVVFQNSWSLLSDQEQEVFARLSIFRGGFSREAAEEIAGVNLSILSALANRSMVARGSKNRYWIHEVLRQFAYERLLNMPGERDAVPKRYVEFFAEYLRKKAGELRSEKQILALKELETENNNVRNAWEMARSTQNVVALSDMTEALGLYYDIHGLFQEGQEMFHNAVWSVAQMQNENTLQSTVPVAEVLASLRSREGWFYLRQGRLNEALDYFNRALESQHRLKYSETDLAGTYLYMGVHSNLSGDTTLARSYLEKSLSGFIKGENSWGMAEALRNLGYATVRLGAQDEARLILQESLEIYRMIKERRGESLALDGIGKIYVKQGELEAAARAFRDSLEIQEQIGDRWSAAGSLMELGSIALKEKNLTEARQFFDRSLAGYRETGDAWSVVQLQNRLGDVELAEGNLEKARVRMLMALQRSVDGQIESGILESLLGLAQYSDMDGDMDMCVRVLEFIILNETTAMDQLERAREYISYLGISSPDRPSYDSDAQEQKELVAHYMRNADTSAM